MSESVGDARFGAGKLSVGDPVRRALELRRGFAPAVGFVDHLTLEGVDGGLACGRGVEVDVAVLAVMLGADCVGGPGVVTAVGGPGVVTVVGGAEAGCAWAVGSAGTEEAVAGAVRAAVSAGTKLAVAVVSAGTKLAVARAGGAVSAWGV